MQTPDRLGLHQASRLARHGADGSGSVVLDDVEHPEEQNQTAAEYRKTSQDTDSQTDHCCILLGDVGELH